jgi:hypothetical protein
VRAENSEHGTYDEEDDESDEDDEQEEGQIQLPDGLVVDDINELVPENAYLITYVR